MDGLHRGFPHWKSWVVLLNNLAVAQAAEMFLWRLQVGLCGPRGTLSLGLLPPWVCLGTVVPLAALLETHCAVLCSPSTNPRSGWRGGSYLVSSAWRGKEGWVSSLDLGRLYSPKSCSKH